METVSDETPAPEPGPETGQEPAASPVTRRPWKGRFARRSLAVVVAVIAAGFLTLFTVDLGRLWPGMVRFAERRGSVFLDRPLHIGSISAYLTPGRFALRDVVIEGRNPGDRPFMKIGRIDIEVPWWTLFRKELHVQLTLDDWAMVVESWPNGLHNVPRLTGPKRQPGRPLPFSTTVDWAHARGGSFTYDDHATPWHVVAPNLSFSLVRANALKQYRGVATFSGGEVGIQSYKPMATSMSTRFVLDGSKVRLEHIDLVTDGSRSHVNGDVDFSKWPAQTYHVTSEVDFRTMKDIFFAREPWKVDGDGVFTGTFKLFSGGRDLSGEFTSENATVNGLEFPNLHGALTWTPTLFAVTHAETDFLGGHARFSYALAPLGSRTGAMATFTTDYTDIDVFDLDRLMSLRGLKLVGLASGDLTLEWPNGKFGSARMGGGRTRIDPPDGLVLATPDLPAVPRAAAPEPAEFDPHRRMGPLVLGVNTSYTIDPEGLTFADSWAATSHSYIKFSGRLARDSSRFPFHVTSHDWQESDRLLASIMTAISGPTGAVQVAGRGTFDGEMTGSFSAPLIQGRFAGEAMRVWDVTWGRASGDIVIQGGYVTLSNSRVGDTPDRSIVPNGRFALGFRKDDAEEINARIAVTNWPVADLKHAFSLDDWPMDGTIASAELNLTGKYKGPMGTGALRITKGAAWGERFDEAAGELAFEGAGMRVRRIVMHKGTAELGGTAYIGWDGTYAFDAATLPNTNGIAVETLDNFKVEGAPLTGQLTFRATGSGEFTHPTYAFEGTIPDLFVGSEGVGAVTGRFSIDGDTMTIDRLAAASSRLQVVGTGSITFDDEGLYPADLRFRFAETALDPYLKFVTTNPNSPFNRLVVGGSLAVRGELAKPNSLTVDTTIDDAALTLFDYTLRNDGPVQLKLDKGQLDVVSLKLAGSGTNLALTGGGNFDSRVWKLSAIGDSSLAVLGLFPQFAGVTASGTARLNASLRGSFDQPRLAGDAVIIDGRIRPLNSPHSLDAINGRIEFGVSPTGANTIDMRGVSGRIGSGLVAFGGNILLDGYEIAEYDLTATGRSLRLRYPTSFTSTVDMDLRLIGSFDQPRLVGDIDVLRVVYNQAADPGLLGFAAAGGGAAPAAAAPEPEVVEGGTGLALEIRVTAPPMPFISTDEATVEGRADLDVRGTFDWPIITGTVELLGGEVTMFSNRYVVREGAIEFRPNSTEPTFDVVAETRPRVEGQTFTVTIGLSGTFSSMNLQFNSDPYLPQTDIISIVFGGVPSIRSAEERALRSSEEQQQILMQTMAASLVANIATSRVSGVFQQAGVIDTLQVTPVISNEVGLQQNPSARITVGRRISPRVYLTYSRVLGDIEEEIILLEYDQSDRLSWVLSRNEDRTFALDFRIRYVF